LNTEIRKQSESLSWSQPGEFKRSYQVAWTTATRQCVRYHRQFASTTRISTEERPARGHKLHPSPINRPSRCDFHSRPFPSNFSSIPTHSRKIVYLL